MNPQPTRVSPDLPASEIHKKLKKGETDALLVTRDDRLMGMITARDIAEAYRIASVNPSMFKHNEK
jgi:CBS domain-containing protein